MPLNQFIKEGLFIIVLLIILIVGAINAYKEKSPSFILLIMSLIILALSSILIINGNINDYKTIYTDYKITINDSVGFNEFYKNYEVVSKSGDVYTVREINNE
jgi:hypothetical protein